MGKRKRFMQRNFIKRGIKSDCIYESFESRLITRYSYKYKLSKLKHLSSNGSIDGCSYTSMAKCDSVICTCSIPARPCETRSQIARSRADVRPYTRKAAFHTRKADSDAISSARYSTVSCLTSMIHDWRYRLNRASAMIG